MRRRFIVLTVLLTDVLYRVPAKDLRSVTKVMGPLPHIDHRSPLNIQTLEEVKLPQYIRKKIAFSAETGNSVYAWLLIPMALDTLRPLSVFIRRRP